MELPNIIKINRDKKGWSQEDLAKKLNISRQAISKWELGESYPYIEKLISLSELFNITLDELIIGKCNINHTCQTNHDNKNQRTFVDFLYSHWWIIFIIIGLLYPILSGDK